MVSLTPAFNEASVPHHNLNLFWLLAWALAIDSDRQRREKDRQRRQRAFQARPPAKRKFLCPRLG